MNTVPLVKTETKRESNIELFRILTMLLIIAHHYVVNSGLLVLMNAETPGIKSFFYWILGAWGKTGINCFVLITGYFMCEKNITLRKFLKLLLEIYFYKLIINTIFLVTGYIPFSVKYVFKCLLPVTSLQQNFTSCFIVFFLFIPFLNILVNNMNENEHRYMIFLLVFIYVLLPTIPRFRIEYNYVTWFCILYICASYIRLHESKLYKIQKYWGGYH